MPKSGEYDKISLDELIFKLKSWDFKELFSSINSGLRNEIYNIRNKTKYLIESETNFVQFYKIVGYYKKWCWMFP